jgi:hypothetical protein
MFEKKELFGFVDEIEFVHRDKNGKVLKHYRSNSRLNSLLRKLHLKRHECIVAVGMANMAGLLLTDVGGTAYDYVAIGTGTTAAAVGDTALGTQKGVRQPGTGTRVTTTQTNDTAQLVANFSKAIDATLTGTDAITEVGVFYDAAGVTVSMLWRQTFAAESMQWDSGDTLTFTCKTQMKQGA